MAITDVDVRLRPVSGFMLACSVAAAVWLTQGAQSEVHGTTIYGYTDDNGNPVYTDSLQQVPEKHRSNVQQFEWQSQEPSGNRSSDARRSLTARVKEVGLKLGSFRSKADGLTNDQVTVLTNAGAAAVVLLAMMYLSKKSPMIRLLALALLIVLGIGTPILLYTSEGGALSTITKKARESVKLNEDRLQQTSPR